MRLVLTADDRIGVLRDGGMVEVSSVFDDIRYRSAADRMPRVIAELAHRRGAIEEIAASGERIPVPALQAPVPRPPKLIAVVGDDREGAGHERQKQDMYLMSPDSVIGPDGTVILPNHEATIFHGDAELALVIGKRAKDVPADERAMEVVAGYTCAINVTARGLGRIGPSRIGTSFDTFTPLGPAIVTTEEIADPQSLTVTLTVNGEPRQQYSTADMDYPLVEVLSFISGYMTLVPGDVILCGAGHQGLEAIMDGDAIEAGIEGIGALSATVSDPLRREWPRDVDSEMA